MPRPDGARLAGGLVALALVGATVPPVAAQGVLEQRAHARLMERIAAPDATLAPFTTDGCSGGMSLVWSYVGDAFPAVARHHGALPPWEACCVTHDRAYHTAGRASNADESQAARLSADSDLRACVVATSDGREAALAESYGMGAETVAAIYDLIGAAMYYAVRQGGAPCTGLPWRWGYGWPDC
jgi:hypothetical protein